MTKRVLFEDKGQTIRVYTPSRGMEDDRVIRKMESETGIFFVQGGGKSHKLDLAKSLMEVPEEKMTMIKPLPSLESSLSEDWEELDPIMDFQDWIIVV